MKKFFLIFLSLYICVQAQDYSKKSIIRHTKFSVSGYLTYDNSVSSPISGATVYLTTGNSIIDSATTDLNGYYKILTNDNGICSLTAKVSQPSGGLTSANMLALQKASLGSLKLEGVKFKAGDFNNSGTIDAYDLLKFMQYYLNPQDYPQGLGWVSETPVISIDGNDVVQDIKTICRGDVLGSFIPVSNSSISGKILYDNTLNTPIANAKVYLKNKLVVIDSTVTDLSGAYAFNNVKAGSYNVIPQITIPGGGINNANALALLDASINKITLEGLKFKAGDIDNSGTISAYDVYLFTSRLLGQISSFPSGDWVTDTLSVVVNNGAIQQDIKVICKGDVLGNFIPGKSVVKGKLAYDNVASTALAGIKIYAQNGTVVTDSTITDAKGDFTFEGLANGKYTLVPKITLPMVLLSPANLFALQSAVAGNITLTGLKFKAGDLDNSGTLTSYDLLLYMSMSNGAISTFPGGNWVADSTVVVVNGGGEVIQDIKALCKGDVLGVNPPLQKNSNKESQLMKPASVENSSIAPAEFALMQNYPNPFNPETSIKYSIPTVSNVKIEVYNVLGQSVKTLFNGVNQAGNFTVKFNGSGLASGAYIYTITANPTDGSAGFSSAKKFILMK